MARTYEPIASQTLGSDTATVSFTSIPATWTDLILVGWVQSTRADNLEGIILRFNSDDGTNYSITKLTGNGSSAASERQSSTSDGAWQITGGNPTERATVFAHIQSYANTNVYKTSLVGSGIASVSSALVTRGVHLWRSTAAITSVRLLPVVGPNLKSGSTFALYGIKAA
jgi:hypothetical protein